MLNYKNLLVLIVLLSLSCKGEVYNRSEDLTEVISASEIERLSDIIKKTGNKSVYGYLEYELKKSSMPHKIFPLAKIMSDKYDNKEAMFDVYSNYASYKGVPSFKALDQEDKIEALTYLIKAYEKGQLQSRDTLKIYSEKGIYVMKKNGTYVINMNYGID